MTAASAPKRLETQPIDPRERIIWQDAYRGTPKPVAQPGEKLIIITWLPSNDGLVAE